MTNFNQVKKEVLKILPNSPLDFELIHAKLVLKWTLKLKPDADETLKIAALSHDIDRAITGITEKDLKDFSRLNEFKRDHAKRSAKFIGEILKKYKYTSAFIKKVQAVVEKHEFGGDEKSDILKNADSLAYFEYNIPSYLKRNGQERTKEKIRFMYNRLSGKGKELLNKLKFEDKKLAKLFQDSINI